MSREREAPGEWAAGRDWRPRVALLALLAWLGWRYARDPEFWSPFSALTLVVHEIGHIVFAPFGETMTALGGSLLQTLVPALAGWLLVRRQGDWFGAAVAGCWLSYSLYDLARYVADASRGELSLVSVGGGEAEHDWTFLLERWALMHRDADLARALRAAAFLALVLSVAWGARLCLLMVRGGNRGTKNGVYLAREGE